MGEWIDPTVARPLDRPPNAVPGVRLVCEARDDVQVDVLHLLTPGRPAVPTDGVAVRCPASSEEILRGDEEFSRRAPFVGREIERTPAMREGNHDATAGKHVLRLTDAGSGDVHAEIILDQDCGPAEHRVIAEVTCRRSRIPHRLDGNPRAIRAIASAPDPDPAMAGAFASFCASSLRSRAAAGQRRSPPGGQRPGPGQPSGPAPWR